MIETQIIAEKKPKLKNPVCIVGLPGIGNIGRIAVGYMIHQLKAKKFAELYSPYFFPFVMVHNDKIHTLRNEFYSLSLGKKDFILIIGDCQTYDPKGHYEVAGKIIDFVKELGCKEIITIGGFSTGEVSKESKVYAILSDEGREKEFKKAGADIKIAGKVGTIVGASGLLIGIGKANGIKGACLLGETSGFPIITDPNAAESVLNFLQNLLGIKIDLAKLREKVEAMHDFIKKLHEIQSQAIEQMHGGKKKEELKYIG